MTVRARWITIAAIACLFAGLPGRAAAEASEEEKAAISALKERAESNVKIAETTFASLGEGELSDEDKKRMRTEARAAIDEAIIACDSLIETYPDEEKWAEGILERTFGVAFWIDRFSVIDDLDYEAMSAESAAANSKNHENAAEAMASAEKAEAAGDTAAAFYDYLEVVQAPTAAAAETETNAARERLAELRKGLSTEAILAYLKKELKAPEAEHRAFAATEMGRLRTSYTADPLARALRDETEPAVIDAILGAFHHTAKRASGEALDLIAKSKNTELKLRVLETLEVGVKGRHGAMAASHFATDSEPAVVERAIRAMETIGGIGGAEALGEVVGERNTPALQRRILDALVRVNHQRAAEILVPFCQPSIEWKNEAEDALVRMGEPAIVPCIQGFGNSKVRKHAHDVLKRITDKTFGISDDKWMEWFVAWKAAGGGPLPRYKRGSEPWMGGDGQGY